MISRNYSEKISFITFFPFFINIFTNAPGLPVDLQQASTCGTVRRRAAPLRIPRN